MDQLGAAVNPDRSLHAEEALIPFLRLMHFGVSLPILVLRGTRRVDDPGVHGGPGMDLEAVLLEVLPDEGKEPLPQMMALQHMTELADGSFVRHGLPPEIDADELTHGSGIVERFLHRRVREIEPVRQEGNPSQALDADRRTAATLAPRVKRLSGSRKLRPRDELFHLLEKLFAAGGLRDFSKPLSVRVSWLMAALHVKDQVRSSSRDSMSRGNYQHIGK
jgi:hypothetical protein